VGVPTISDQSRPLVTDRQSLVIDALLRGATHRAAAELVGVQRSTVTGWVNHHVGFEAELNARRQARLAAISDQVHESLCRALDLIDEKIADGHLNAAIVLLRHVGLKDVFRVANPGPSTVEGVASIKAARLDTELAVSQLPSREAITTVQHRSQRSTS
jgi:hypothetical protein